MDQQNELDIIRPITIMLDGPASYHAWSQIYDYLSQGS